MKKILCVHQGYELYGSDRSFALSVESLHDLYPDIIIDVMLPKEGPILQLFDKPIYNIIINNDLSVIRKKDIKNNLFLFTYKLLKGITNAIKVSKKYDLVYVNTIVVLDYIIASRFMSCLTVLHIREIQIGVVGKIFSKIILFSKMKLIFNSNKTLQAYPLLKNQINNVVINGVDGFLSIPLKEKNSMPIRILMLGRLTKLKGQMLFLQALNILQNKYNISARIIGDSFEEQHKFKNELLVFTKEHDLENIVCYKSFVDNPHDEYEWSDIVIIPSIQPESFGRIAIEAMSASRCVIASNHGGLSEIIEDKINGVHFIPNDLNSLVLELIALLDSPELIKKYSQEAKFTFQNKFSEPIYKKRFKEVISNFRDKK